MISAAAALIASLAAMAAGTPSVGLVDEPRIQPQHVAVELVARGPAGVRVTASDGSWWWLRWLDRGQDAALVMMPVRAAEPGVMTWRGRRSGGLHRLSFRVTWPGACPCRVEVTSGGEPAMVWRDVSP